MDWIGCEVIEVVPGKVSGTSVIRGSRVPADQVLANYDAGVSVDDIAYNFDLKPVDIKAVVAYAAGQPKIFT